MTRRRRASDKDNLARKLQQSQYVKPGGIKYVPKEQALRQMKKSTRSSSRT